MGLDYREGPKPSFEEFAEINELNIEFQYVVCPTCEGSGTHVNPSIDHNGLTADDMYELGEDFMFEYSNGSYDVQCNECNGLRVVKTPIFSKDSDIEDRWNKYIDYIYQCRQEIAMGY